MLLNLTTRGYGWNGSAGIQWQPSRNLRAGLAWKSNTRMRTNGPASGTASALFTALNLNASPIFSYQAQIENNLPQAFNAGVTWQARNRLRLGFEGDFTAWGQAFQQLPISLTAGSRQSLQRRRRPALEQPGSLPRRL